MFNRSLRSRTYTAWLQRPEGAIKPFELKVVFTGLAVVSVMAVANFLSYQYDLVYDFTQNQRHSLSSETIRVLESLDQPVHALILFHPVDPSSAIAQDYLEKFSFYTPLLTYEVINPVSEPESVESSELLHYNLVFVTSANQAEVYHIDEWHLTKGLLQVTNSDAVDAHLPEIPTPPVQRIFLPPFHAAMLLVIILIVIPLGFLSLGLTAWLRRR